MKKWKFILIIVLTVLTQIQYIPMPFNCDKYNLGLFQWLYYTLIRYGLIVILIVISLLFTKRTKYFAYLVVILHLLVGSEFFVKDKRRLNSIIFAKINQNRSSDFYNPYLTLEKVNNTTYTFGMTGILFDCEYLYFKPNHGISTKANFHVNECVGLNKDWIICYED